MISKNSFGTKRQSPEAGSGQSVVLDSAGTMKNQAGYATGQDTRIERAKTWMEQSEAQFSASGEFPTQLQHRILVVDDDRDVRQLSIDVLAGSGYDVEGVKDGAAGWDALQCDDYDLVITDNQMPRMTGIEMIEKMRSARMVVPIIMATRILPTDAFARKPWLTPDATLQRPFSNDELLEKVRKVLGTDDANGGSKVTFLPKNPERP